MAIKKNTRRFTAAAAIALHTEANKSDPFAARRMALVLSKHPREAKHVAEEAQRLVGYRTERAKRNGCADWCDPVTEAKLSLLKTALTVQKPRVNPARRRYRSASIVRAKAAA